MAPSASALMISWMRFVDRIDRPVHQPVDGGRNHFPALPQHVDGNDQRQQRVKPRLIEGQRQPEPEDDADRSDNVRQDMVAIGLTVPATGSAGRRGSAHAAQTPLMTAALAIDRQTKRRRFDPAGLQSPPIASWTISSAATTISTPSRTAEKYSAL
jgi:hypothetical protein